jgi:hypothetical protein
MGKIIPGATFLPGSGARAAGEEMQEKIFQALIAMILWGR